MVRFRFRSRSRLRFCVGYFLGCQRGAQVQSVQPIRHQGLSKKAAGKFKDLP